MKLNTKYFYNIYKNKGGVVSYQVFKKILDSYFKKVTDACVDEGLGLNFRSNLGFLCVHQYIREPKLKENGNISAFVNWKESNSLKQSIIDKGGIPLEVYKDNKGNIIGNNGGEAWLVYFTNTNFFKWLYTPNLYLKGHANVTFKISWGNTKKLAKGVNQDSEILYS